MDKPAVDAKPGTTPVDLNTSVAGTDGSNTAPSRELTGSILGEYLVLEHIGSGGGGRVYKAQHRHMERTVAIKVLHDAHSFDPALRLRFRREVKASARLIHPNIVTAFDAGDHRQTLYLVMEYIDGQSLLDVVRQDGPLPVKQATDFVMQAASGLAYAHSQGVIHRDVKPSNLIRDRHARVKILDMGLAQLCSMTTQGALPSLSSELTKHGTVVGTVGYISPEQMNDAHQVDARTDIYSLGCTYFFLLTGQPPYTGSLMETIAGHAREPVPSLRKHRNDVPPSLDNVFQQMIAKDASERFTSMGDVMTALEPFGGHKSSEAAALRTISSKPSSASDHGVVDSSTLPVNKAVGFDVGTNTSYMSWIGKDGLPQTIKNRQGAPATPSVVRYQDRSFTVGEEALESPESHENIADRFVCRVGSDESHRVLADKKFPNELLMAVIIRQLVADAQRSIGYFSHLAYTVPGCFGDVQRKAYEDAFSIASVHTLPPINASSAVAVNFSFLNGWLNPQRRESSKTLLVLRYGGGSFDATVLRVRERSVSTLAICGDVAIGGGVWDERIVQCVADQLKTQHGVDIDDDPARQFLLRRHCEFGKIALTNQDQFQFKVHVKGRTLEGAFRRGFLNRLGADLLERAELLTHEALVAAGVTWDGLDHVLLAGGTSRMPIVREAIDNWSRSSRSVSLVDSDAASHGAALFAQIQIEGPGRSIDFHLQDMTSHWFGVRGVDRKTGQKRMAVVIPKGAALPAAARATFRTQREGQTSISLEIAEGMDANAADGRVIGSCDIDNLPPGQPADTPFEVEFRVEENGRVSVFVESIASGRLRSLEIRRAEGINVENCLRWRDWLDTGPLPRIRIDPALRR